MAEEKQASTKSSASREIVVTRIFDAPRELVFEMWTDPKHVTQWWGPNGFTSTIYEMDVKPGGVWRFVMHGPDGVDYQNRVVYREIVKPERLVYAHVSGSSPPRNATRWSRNATQSRGSRRPSDALPAT